MTFDEYTALFNAYKAAHPIQYQPTNYGGVASEVSGGGGSQDAGSYANDAAERQLAAEWIATLTPDQQADYAKATESKDAANAKKMPLMGLAGLATVGTLGLLNPAIMGGTGFLGGGGAAAAGSGAAAAGGAAPTALDVGMASLYGPGTAGMTGAEYAALTTAAGGVPGGASILSGALPAAGFDAAGVPITSGLLSQGITTGLNPTDSRLANGTQTTPPPGTPTTTTGTTPSWYDSVKDLLPSGALDALKAAGLIGGAIAGAKETPGETTTQQSKTDPRVDPYIYGDQGVLKQAQDWYLKNKTGVNANMQAGWDSRLGLLTDPALQAQIAKMKLGSQGLMSTPIAGNPWLKG